MYSSRAFNAKKTKRVPHRAGLRQSTVNPVTSNRGHLGGAIPSLRQANQCWACPNACSTVACALSAAPQVTHWGAASEAALRPSEAPFPTQARVPVRKRCWGISRKPSV